VDAHNHDRALRRAPAPLADGRTGETRGSEGGRDARLPGRSSWPPATTPQGIPSLPAERASVILEGIGEAIIVLDRQARVTWWNAAAERATGVRREDVIGLRLFERFPRLAGTLAERALKDAMHRREPREYAGWQYPGPSSDVAPATAGGIYDARVWPLDDGGLLLHFSDVSARESQRRELEARIREVEELRDFARAMAGIADSSALLRLLCNAALAHLGGCSSVAARDLGDGRGEFIAVAGAAWRREGATFPLAGSLIARVLDTGRPVVLDDYASESPFFEAVAAEEELGAIVMTPLVAHGEVLGVFGLARRRGEPAFTASDIARLGVFVDHASLAAWKARLIERAEAANEAKANFLASMSHELRTPLTALTGYGELLADEEILGPLAKAQLDVVERMRSVTHQLSALIDELLTYSSLEAGREHARMAMVPPSAIVEEAALVVQPIAQTKGIAFEVADALALPAIRTDADKVRQILVNLLGNAVKFTDRGTVRLDYATPPGELHFVVSDTGIGIASESHYRLFQAFGQLDGGLTRRHGGTGLGLYISRRLAELLGGRITLESEPGNGATFTLILPR
jgi:signal transduction histidine kinase